MYGLILINNKREKNMSLVYLSSKEDQFLFDLIKKYRFQLSDPKLTLSDLNQMADHLAMVLQNETNSKAIACEMSAFFGEIENKENQRRDEDKNFLTFIHQLGFEVKQLKLQIDVLPPSIIEAKLDELNDWHKSLCGHNAFQNDFFQKELDYLKDMLEDLYFNFHFPIVAILEKSNDQKVIQYLKDAQAYFFAKNDDLLFPKQDLLEFLDKKGIKHLRKERDRHFVTQIILECLQDTIG